MITPGFAAEFSLYNSGKLYRLTAGSSTYLVSPVVMPQRIKCEEYECSNFGGIPGYCIRCEGERPE